MRLEILLAALMLAGTPLAGCLDGGEELDPTSAPPEVSESGDEGPSSEGESDPSASEDEGSQASEANETEASDEGASDDSRSNASAETSPDPSIDERAGSLAVVAHVDTGINPYHEAFREDSKIAHTHPSEYIEGYPEDAKALNLTLDADSWEEAFEADRDVWSNVTEGQLYWIPGTRIVGAVTFGDGGTFCPLVEPSPANIVGDPGGGSNASRCTEHPILDDHGHGTMTASRMAGDGTSLCPDCRIVSIEDLGSENTLWAAESGWIDVQTNSWGSLVPDPASALVDEALDGSFAENIEQAAQTHLTYFSSGNGFAGFFGVTPWPTHLQPTHQEGVVSVGAHDNGDVAHWQGTPPHVVADGYAGLTAGPRELSGVDASPFACCTSAASPYAAGLGARIVQEARTILEDTSEGPDEGVLAKGPEGKVADGPLEDGELTLDELRRFVKHTAEERPSEGRHDGAEHWMGDPSADEAVDQSQRWGPGGNPYCPGCVTSPVSWKEIPSQAPAYPIIGYGGATPFALTTALEVLQGQAGEPDRSEVDEYFEAQQPVHNATHDPVP